jgi:hypothetical protein
VILLQSDGSLGRACEVGACAGRTDAVGDADEDLVPKILTGAREVGYKVDRKIGERLGWADTCVFSFESA